MMAVHYMPNNGGGGFFSRLLPQVLGMAGTAIVGPMGGQIGSLIGNAATGNNAGLANQIIGSIKPSAGNVAPTQTQFPSFQPTDWGDPENFRNWQNWGR